MSKKNKVTTVCLLLAVVTLIAFWRVGSCDFVNYDDPSYVTENIHIRNGITLEAIRWAFTTGHAANWHPLTWLSHMLDVQLFGLAPGWHHLTNLLFHLVNALLLFLVLNRMTKALWQSAFVAALFALHPLHVESVAWVAERKDVLSTFFWMLTMGAYTYYVERPRIKSYLAVFISFALGLMAKPMLVTLPFVLLLLDYWPLQRFGQIEPNQTTPLKTMVPATRNKRKGKKHREQLIQAAPAMKISPVHIDRWPLIRPLLWEKIPLFALAALSSIITYIVQKEGGAVKSVAVFPLGVRIENAFVSYIVYIWKAVWPTDLAVLYPHPGVWPLWQAMGAALLLIISTALVIWKAKKFPYLALGWLWFTGTLVPVIGIVQVGVQAMADRYTYIPMIGLFIVAAWGIPELLKKLPHRSEVFFVSATSTFTCFFILTWAQVGYWQNGVVLFDHTLKVVNGNGMIYYNRGDAYSRVGNYRQAIEDFDKAIEIDSKASPDVYYGRGIAHSKLGDYRQAIADYDRAFTLHTEAGPEAYLYRDHDFTAEAFYNRGLAYGKLGDHLKAIADFDRAIEISPQNAEAFCNRGIAYSSLRDFKQAIEDFDRAVQINRKDSEAYFNRGVAYGQHGDHRHAIDDLDKVIEINPKHSGAFYNRAIAFSEIGKHREALEDLKAAAKFGNDDAKSFLRGKGMTW